MSIATERRERTAAEIARDCRRDRLVDWWVSGRHRHGPELHARAVGGPASWTEASWAYISRQAGQRDADPPPDAELRAAVIAEIDKIATNLERRRGTA